MQVWINHRVDVIFNKTSYLKYLAKDHWFLTQSMLEILKTLPNYSILYVCTIIKISGIKCLCMYKKRIPLIRIYEFLNKCFYILY